MLDMAERTLNTVVSSVLSKLLFLSFSGEEGGVNDVDVVAGKDEAGDEVFVTIAFVGFVITFLILCPLPLSSESLFSSGDDGGGILLLLGIHYCFSFCI